MILVYVVILVLMYVVILVLMYVAIMPGVPRGVDRRGAARHDASVDLGTFLTTAPVAGAAGWFGRQLLEPWLRRRALRVEHEQTTRATHIELLVHLLGNLREHFTWLSGIGAADKPQLAEERAREIAEWITANCPRFPKDVARVMRSLRNTAYFLADVDGPAREIATGDEAHRWAVSNWEKLEAYKERLERE